MWLLYQFNTSHGLLVTRGRNSAEARKCLEILKIKVISEFSYCDISAAYQYSQNHPFDWINSPPRWFDFQAPWLPKDLEFRNRFYKTPA